MAAFPGQNWIPSYMNSDWQQKTFSPQEKGCFEINTNKIIFQNTLDYFKVSF